MRGAQGWGVRSEQGGTEGGRAGNPRENCRELREHPGDQRGQSPEGAAESGTGESEREFGKEGGSGEGLEI